MLNGNNQQLRAGDEVTSVADAKLFNALGAVKKTGQIEFIKPNPSLLDAISQSGGLLATPGQHHGRLRVPPA